MATPLQSRIVNARTDRCVVALQGDLDARSLPELEETLTCLRLEGYRFIKLDLGQVERIQSCTYGVLLEAMALLERSGGCMSFANVDRHAGKVLRLLGVNTGVA